MKKILALVALYAFMHGAYAQQDTATNSGDNEVSEMATDRPDQTESAMLVPAGALQVETGFAIETIGDTKGYTYNTTLLRMGLNEYIELRLVQEYLGYKNALMNVKGMSPTSLGAKIKVAKASGAIPEMSFIGHVTMRNGSEDFAQSYVSGDFRFSMEWELSDMVGMGMNLGTEHDGEMANTTAIYTFVIGISPAEKFGMFVELYGFITEPDPGLDNRGKDHRFNGGVTYAITDLVQFDVSAGVGLNEGSIDNFISTGLSFRLFK